MVVLSVLSSDGDADAHDTECVGVGMSAMTNKGNDRHHTADNATYEQRSHHIQLAKRFVRQQKRHLDCGRAHTTQRAIT